MAAHRAGAEASNGLEPFRRPLAGLGERSKAVSEALRTVARHGRGSRRSSDKAELEDNRGWADKRVPSGLGRPRGPRLAAAGSWRPPDWVWRGSGLFRRRVGRPDLAAMPLSGPSCARLIYRFIDTAIRSGSSAGGTLMRENRKYYACVE